MEGNYRARTGYGSTRPQAGIINRIQMENFMCHNNFEIELGDSINFISGPNASGKSAILTALLIAFGSRAIGTQRASTLKDYIKTGCSHAMVRLEIKNHGEDAFKPDVYGDAIIIECRISEASSTTVIKNHQGEQVAGHEEDLRKLVEHFNIDVENPCVIMSQDKSREFLHSGDNRDKFRDREKERRYLLLANSKCLQFFFKATFLHQEDKLLKSRKQELEDLDEVVLELESTIGPVEMELKELQLKIKDMEHVEEISSQVQLLRKKLAWSCFYDIDRHLEEQNVKIDAFKSRIPKCQERIDHYLGKIVELNDLFNKKKQQISSMVERTSGVRRMKEELQQALSLATKERLELERVRDCKLSYIQKIMQQAESLEKQSQVVRQEQLQAEESDTKARLKELQDEFDVIVSKLSSLKEKEDDVSETLSKRKEEVDRTNQEGRTERQVPVRTYDISKTVAFDHGISNVKEVRTLEGHKMFSRGSSQMILPPNKKAKTTRLCGSYDNQIEHVDSGSSNAKDQARLEPGKKRSAEGLQELGNKLQSVKACGNRGPINTELVENRSLPASSVDDLYYEISKLKDDIQKDVKKSLEETRTEMEELEAKVRDLKMSFANLCESAIEEINAFEAAERELMHMEEDLRLAEEKKSHYEEIMGRKVLSDIKEAEAQYQELKIMKAECHKKASMICPQSEIEALGGVEVSTLDQLSAQLQRLNSRFQRESERFTESIEDLKMLYEIKERIISRKQQAYAAFRAKSADERDLNVRWSNFQRDATLLKRHLTWIFEGINGCVEVSYEEETLSVKMPQGALHNNVRDTRGLSGGDHSYSMLCFMLALHEMTEAPFRALDEFDIFMDPASRKISFDTLVEFALAQGSQWIFITPHDISMVKQTERIKKHQMPSPRS